MNNNTHTSHSTDFWEELINRYYDATTSEKEEAMLKAFLASEEGADSRYDEIRSTMAYMSVGKRKYRSQKKSTTKGRLLKTQYAGMLGVAACVALIFLAVRFTPTHRSLNDEKDLCIAYVNGQSITDREEVFRLMEQSVRNVTEDNDEITEMENQLNKMFNTLSE